MFKRRRKVVVCDDTLPDGSKCFNVVKDNATLKDGRGLQFCKGCAKARRKLDKLLREPFKFYKPSLLSIFAMYVRVELDGDNVFEGLLTDALGTPVESLEPGKPAYLSVDSGEKPFFETAPVESVKATHEGWSFRAGGRDWVARAGSRVYH